MEEVLHRGTKAIEAVRRAIQHRQASLRALARRHGINLKTIASGGGESTADHGTVPTVRFIFPEGTQRHECSLSRIPDRTSPIIHCLHLHTAAARWFSWVLVDETHGLQQLESLAVNSVVGISRSCRIEG